MVISCDLKDGVGGLGKRGETEENHETSRTICSPAEFRTRYFTNASFERERYTVLLAKKESDLGVLEAISLSYSWMSISF